MSEVVRSITVVLPTFNEQDIIREMIDEVGSFAANNHNFSFIFVDDGSVDETPALLRAASSTCNNGNITFVCYQPNMGKGYAVKRGIEKADADAVCFIDSDMAYSLDYLKVIEEQLHTNDIVIGSRIHANKIRNSSLRRHFLGECFNRLARFLLRLPFRDTQAGLKALRTEVARRIFQKLSINGFGFDAELLFIARNFKYSIAEIPVTESPFHANRKSNLSLMRDSAIMFCNILMIRWNKLIGRYE